MQRCDAQLNINRYYLPLCHEPRSDVSDDEVVGGGQA